MDPARPTILCGDFNAVFNRTTDRRGSNPLDHAHDSCQALRTLFSNCCVTDIWRRLHPTERGFSWCKWDGSVASRIDLIGCPTSWLTQALSCTLLPALSQIILLSFSTVLFQWPFPEALAAGNLTALFSSHQSTSTLYGPFGHPGKKGSPHSLPCNTGGMRARNESEASRSNFLGTI